MHELENVLLEFIRTGDTRFAEQLKSAKIKQIDLILSRERLLIKMRLGLLKTEGVIIAGPAITAAIERLMFLRRLTGIHIRRPRAAGQADPRLMARLRATFG